MHEQAIMQKKFISPSPPRAKLSLGPPPASMDSRLVLCYGFGFGFGFGGLGVLTPDNRVEVSGVLREN